MTETRWAVRCSGESAHAEWLSKLFSGGWSPDKGDRHLFDDRAEAIGQLTKWREWVKSSICWGGTKYHLVRIGPKPPKPSPLFARLNNELAALEAERVCEAQVSYHRGKVAMLKWVIGEIERPGEDQ